MRMVLCWGGPLHEKLHAVFNKPTFSCPWPLGENNPAGIQHFPETYTLVRITYRDRPTLTIYECSVWLAKSFDATQLDGKPIIELVKERRLPFTSEVVSADAPCWPRKVCPECNGLQSESRNVICGQCDGVGKVLA